KIVPAVSSGGSGTNKETAAPGSTAGSAQGSPGGANSGSGQGIQKGEPIRPQLLRKTEPAYPEKARAEARTGTVTVSLEVLANGQVGRVSIQQSSGHADLDAAAVKDVKKWRFAPAKDSLSGQAISCFVNIPVVFTIK
ncbi:MAG: energy transducer TonB, partial [Sporomusaceae bacterium]|nr:energy transducer TonB [Sporomusaceae bacterium]